jgi:hypothetical protein
MHDHFADTLRPAPAMAGAAPSLADLAGLLRPRLPLQGEAPAGGRVVVPEGVSADPLTAIDWGTRLPQTVVDVWFAPAGATIDGVTDFGVSAGWTEWEQQQVMHVLARVAAVTDLEFRVSETADGAEFRLGSLQLDAFDAVAFMVPPQEAYAGFMGFDPDWLRMLAADSLQPLLAEGGFVYAGLLEELTHGLGLAHAHDDGGSSTILQGVTAPVGSFGIGGLNQGVYTVMNYNEGWPGGPDGPAYQDGGFIVVDAYGYEATPMALDVAVLQAKYGADAGHATGDDVYRLPGVNEVGTFFECLWDAAGSDTLRYDGALDAVLDLRAATLRGEAGGGGWVSHAQGVRGGYTIAHGVVIENATGGAGADRIVGQEAANRLLGRDGHDSLLGGAGADTLGGQGGADRLEGGRGADRLGGGGGADSLWGGDGKDTLDGGPGCDRLAGGAGSDLYVFASASQAGLRAMRDVMAGLQAIDRIDLAAIDADPALAGDQAFTWIGAAAFSGRPGELRVVPGLVQGDLDGDGLADFEIGLEGGVLPGADSFFL